MTRTDVEDRRESPLPTRILVTGGTGFIGGHVCARLLQQGHELTLLDLHPRIGSPPGVRFVRGDVRDADTVRDAMDGCEAVLHLAAAHHDAGIAEQTYFDVNVGSTELLVREMTRRGLRKICYYSSAAVYGSGPTVRYERSPSMPENPYGRSKWDAEGVLQKAVAAGQVDALIIRPSVTFGPNNFANMYSLLRQIDSGMFLQVGSGSNIKSLSYVENLCDFTLWAWRRHRGGIDTFNWVESPDLTSAQIAMKLADALGRSLPSIQVPMSVALLLASPFEVASRLLGRSLPVSRARVRKLASDQTQFSSAKARATGFVPGVSIDEAFRRTVEWYRAIGRSASRVMRIPPADVERRPRAAA
ncbi:MAG: NAD(P)-dependent oxidoreductase [Gemmatimonadaceae bacterium]|nr:NAD(P)-dependent oxidoreductase [Gemmatimonadaceae bacterium]